MRQAGKYGLVRRDRAQWIPMIEDYLTEPLPPAPAVVDRATKVPDWPVYANDTIGDCTCAAVGHQIQAWTSYAGSEVTLTDSDIIGLYSAVTGYVPGDESTDNGANPPDVLNYWMRTGVAGHKIDSWAALRNPKDVWLLKRCLNIFGSVYLAVSVPASAIDQFNAGEAWYVVPGSPIDGYHAVPLQRMAAGEYGCMEVVTWGALQRMTLRWAQQNIIDAYVIVTRDWVTANGDTITELNLAELRADMHAVG
jgi:hypothetical protein